MTDVSLELVSSSENLGWQNNGFIIMELMDVLLPEEVVLHNSYPNPFNPSTTIKYDVPVGGMNINLSIYDIRGRLVNELVNEFQNVSAASYEVVWDANMMSSGVYFVKLTADNIIKTQKIMLIK